jgi:hypothetical protein
VGRTTTRAPERPRPEHTIWRGARTMRCATASGDCGDQQRLAPTGMGQHEGVDRHHCCRPSSAAESLGMVSVFHGTHLVERAHGTSIGAQWQCGAADAGTTACRDRTKKPSVTRSDAVECDEASVVASPKGLPRSSHGPGANRPATPPQRQSWPWHVGEGKTRPSVA